MAFVETWDETTPNGSVHAGSDVDDLAKEHKRAVRERHEGDVTLAGWCVTFGTTAKPKEGMARAFFGTAAQRAAKPNEDGRMFFETDTGKFYHLATAGDAEINYASPGDAEIWTAVQTINPGTTPVIALQLDIDALASAGTRDSHSVDIRGRSFDTGVHNTDWRHFVDVTSNAGASQMVWQSRIDAGGFANRAFLSDAGLFTGARLESTVATGTAPLIVASTTKVINLNADTVDGISLPGTAAAVLTDHNRATHDALGTGAIVFEDETQTLTAKTLTTPTIASFVNSTHDHQAAAGGGTLVVAALTDHSRATHDGLGTGTILFTGEVQSITAVHTFTATPLGTSAIWGGDTGISVVHGGATNFMMTSRSSANDAQVRISLPYNCTLKNFHVRLHVAPGVGENVAFTVRKNGVDTIVTATISGGGSTEAADTTNSVSFVATDEISIKMVGSTSAASGTAMWSAEFVRD